MTWLPLLALLSGVTAIWLLGANIMHDIMCRLAIDGVLELRARGTPEAYVQEAIRTHHEQLIRMTLGWPFSGSVLVFGIIKARWF